MRLRPAYVLAALACAALAAVLTFTIGRQSVKDQTGEITAVPESQTISPVPDIPPDEAPDPLANPPTAGFPETPVPEAAAAVTEDAQTDDPLPDEIVTAKPQTGVSSVEVPPSVDSPSVEVPPSAPPVRTEPPATGNDQEGLGPDQTAGTSFIDASSIDDQGQASCQVEVSEDSATPVTLYYTCGGDSLVPLRRQVDDTSLQGVIDAYLAGPTPEETKAGFSGPAQDSLVPPMAQARLQGGWASIDFEPGFTLGGDALNTMVSQLSAAAFEYPGVNLVEYRLGGSCGGFSSLRGSDCELHTQQGALISALVAEPLGGNEPIIYESASEGARSLGALAAGTRITTRRQDNNAGNWAEVITPSAEFGWVNTRDLAGRPLEFTPEVLAEMEELARQFTSAPGVEDSVLSPDGLVLRWGPGEGKVVVIPTGEVRANFWSAVRGNLAIPRPSQPLAGSLASLLWIGGFDGLTEIAVNTPGQLGTPHPQFDGLSYVSVYNPNITEQVLPAVHPGAPEDTTQADEFALSLPPPLDPQPGALESFRARVSVFFNFIDTGSPRIYGAEAIWSSLL